LRNLGRDPGPRQRHVNFAPPNTQIEDYPTVQALLFMGRLTLKKAGGRTRYAFFIRINSARKRRRSNKRGPAPSNLNRHQCAPESGSFVPAYERGWRCRFCFAPWSIS